MNIKGIIPALITPFREDFSIDHDALSRLVEREIEGGADGFYVCGSTAECFLLTAEERKAVVETVVKAADRRVPIIAQIGNIGTAQAVELAKHAADAGVDAVSSVPPFYFKFSVDEIAGYYEAIAKAAGLPVVVYSIPAFSGVAITSDNLRKIIDASGAEGLKYTAQDLFELERIRRANPELTIFSGYDEIMASALPIGIDGSIGSTFNVMLPKYKALVEAYKRGDNAAVSAKQTEVNRVIDVLIKVGVNPGIKYLLTKEGIPCGHCRPPFGQLTKENMELLDSISEGLWA